jgi:hypothetical protein
MYILYRADTRDIISKSEDAPTFDGNAMLFAGGKWTDNDPDNIHVATTNDSLQRTGTTTPEEGGDPVESIENIKLVDEITLLTDTKLGEYQAGDIAPYDWTTDAKLVAMANDIITAINGGNPTMDSVLAAHDSYVQTQIATKLSAISGKGKLSESLPNP